MIHRHRSRSDCANLSRIAVPHTGAGPLPSILEVCIERPSNTHLSARAALGSCSFTQTHHIIMVARSFSKSAVILLLLVSVSSVARGQGPAFTALSPNQVKAVWGSSTVLSGGTKPSSSLNSLPGWAQIATDILAAGGTVAGSAGGASDRARCHMIGDALGGKGRKNNLFSCFAYFNNPGMFHFERQLQAEINSLTGAQQCEMTVTLSYTPGKLYPTKVNMDAECKGSQFFNVNIDNAFPDSNVKIEHLCIPSFPLEPGSFRGTSTTISGATAC